MGITAVCATFFANYFKQLGQVWTGKDVRKAQRDEQIGRHTYVCILPNISAYR